MRSFFNVLELNHLSCDTHEKVYVRKKVPSDNSKPTSTLTLYTGVEAIINEATSNTMRFTKHRIMNMWLIRTAVVTLCCTTTTLAYAGDQQILSTTTNRIAPRNYSSRSGGVSFMSTTLPLLAHDPMTPSSYTIKMMHVLRGGDAYIPCLGRIYSYLDHLNGLSNNRSVPLELPTTD